MITTTLFLTDSIIDCNCTPKKDPSGCCNYPKFCLERKCTLCSENKLSLLSSNDFWYMNRSIMGGDIPLRESNSKCNNIIPNGKSYPTYNQSNINNKLCVSPEKDDKSYDVVIYNTLSPNYHKKFNVKINKNNIFTGNNKEESIIIWPQSCSNEKLELKF